MNHSSVLRWLQENSPVEPSLLDGAGLQSLLTERIAAFGGTESQYIELLSRSPEEVDRLFAGIAVPETWFFRYPRSYDLLLEYLRCRLASGAAEIRLLSIGCATGQEAYCMALTAMEAGWTGDRVSIEGIDRNSDFLRVAAAGQYGASSVRNEMPAWSLPFLHRHGDSVAVDAKIRAMVRFTRTDITGPLSLQGRGPFDVVFCRNVLIYLNAAAREQLMSSICAELSPGGLLLVGHAEQFMRGSLPLRPVSSPHTFAFERILPSSQPTVLAPETPLLRKKHVAFRPMPAARVDAARMTKIVPPAPLDDSIEDARELADSGRMQDAEAMIRGITAKDGPSASSMELLGMIRMSLNDPEAAKRFFEQAVYLEPDRSASLLQLALLSERSGDPRRATAYWERATRAAKRASREVRS